MEQSTSSEDKSRSARWEIPWLTRNPKKFTRSHHWGLSEPGESSPTSL